MNGRFVLSTALAACVLGAAWPARADEKSVCIAASEKAQSLRDDRKLLEAREQFLACARDACPAAIRKDCADQVSDLVKRVPSVVFHAKDAHGQDQVAVRVSADGRVLTEQLDGRSISLDPGVHTFRFEAAGSTPTEQQIVLSEGEHDRAVSARFGSAEGAPVASTSRGAPIGAFIVGGVGLVSMAIAPDFYAMGLSQNSSDLQPPPIGCAPAAGGSGCSPDEVASIHTKLVVGDVFLLAGAALLAGGVVWAIVHYTAGHHEAANPAAASARFDVVPTAYGRGAVATTTIRW